MCSNFWNWKLELDAILQDNYICVSHIFNYIKLLLFLNYWVTKFYQRRLVISIPTIPLMTYFLNMFSWVPFVDIYMKFFFGKYMVLRGYKKSFFYWCGYKMPPHIQPVTKLKNLVGIDLRFPGRSTNFGVWTLEIGVWSLEFRVWSLAFGVWEFGWKSPKLLWGDFFIIRNFLDLKTFYFEVISTNFTSQYFFQYFFVFSVFFWMWWMTYPTHLLQI